MTIRLPAVSIISAVILLAGCQAAPVAAPPVETAAAETSAFDAAGLDALEAAMKAAVDEQKVYGIATRLVKDGKVVQAFEYGLANVETGAPIEDDTIYRIYSMSKPIVGVAMMQLYERGAFSLDDPVTKFVPEFANLKVIAGKNADGKTVLVPAKRPPNMREVMSHTAGFAYGLGGDDVANTAFRDKKILESPDLGVFIDRVAEVPLLFQPGTDWSYSAAVDVQGAIIERISGKTLGAYLKENIFDPLGMVDTGFYVPEAEYSRLSQVFGTNPETGTLVPVPYPAVMFRKETIAMESGGGGLVSTLDDYAHFCQMMLNEGTYQGQQILKPETVRLMRTNVLPEGKYIGTDGSLGRDVREGVGFGLDFGVIDDPQRMGLGQGAGTYFWGGAAGTWFWIDPTNNLYYIGMIQRFGRGGEPLDLRGESAKLVYEALKK